MSTKPTTEDSTMCYSTARVFIFYEN